MQILFLSLSLEKESFKEKLYQGCLPFLKKRYTAPATTVTEANIVAKNVKSKAKAGASFGGSPLA